MRRLIRRNKIKILKNVIKKLQQFQQNKQNKQIFYIINKGVYRFIGIGICYFIYEELISFLNIKRDTIMYNDIRNNYFKDFSYENAKKIAVLNNYTINNHGLNNSKPSYWWSIGINCYDFKHRIEFLEWMINRLENKKDGNKKI
jgi:hypothetical protein